MKNMLEKKKIVITGHLGFVGSVVARNLRAAGYDVWGIDKRTDNDDKTLVTNLLDFKETRDSISKIHGVDVLIHMAALAHGEKPPLNYSIFDFNVNITENVIKTLTQKIPHMILLSSVAVYGEDDRSWPVRVDATTRPATEYGRSKLACEDLILNAHFKKYDILRMAPVYDNMHLKDVSKRVYFPASRVIKMRISPAPYYSLCHVEHVCDVIQNCILRNGSGGQMLNVADPIPYSQNELVKWFKKGVTMPLPLKFARPLFFLGRLIPGEKGYALRCLFSKLFFSNTYE